jgi:hypothetical protein
MWSRIETLSDFIETYSSYFLSSDKSELGILWLDDTCSRIIHRKTVLEEDIDIKDPDQYSFMHHTEWENHPAGITGNYDDYPRGRIFYQNHQYQVEINTALSPQIESLIRHEFNLPSDTIFKFGYW